MAESLLFVVGGLLALVVGGELLVRGAAALAVLARISAAVVGLTVVALGTSMPELVVSVQSAAAGKPGLAVGNVVGSNLFNLAAILGLAACVRPLVVDGRGARRDAVVMLVAAVALLGVAWNGTIDRGEGVVLLAAQAAFMVYLLRASKSAGEDVAGASGAPGVPARDWGWGRAIVALVAGALLLAVGSTALVRGASVVASALGVSETVIGLTIVAAGTSTPELVTSLVATVRGQDEVAVANVVGSNIFNVFGILGLSAILEPLPVPASIVSTDLWWMLGLSTLTVLLLLVRPRLGRGVGVLFLAIYAAYTVGLLSATS